MSKLSAAALTIIAAGLSVSTASEARDVVLEYRLPKAVVGFAVSHMITKCPDADGKGFEMEVSTSITPVNRAGETVRINAAGSIFVDRQIKLEYFPNGTIQSFNGSSDGQGEALVVAGVKALSYALSTRVGTRVQSLEAPTNQLPSTFACLDWVKNALAVKEATKANLTGLRSRIYSTGLPQDASKEIAEAERVIAAIEASLTVQSEPQYWTPLPKDLRSLPAISGHETDICTPSSSKKCHIEFSSLVEAGNLKAWFKPVAQSALDDAFARAGYGQLTRFQASGSIEVGNEPGLIPVRAIRSLAYRKPLRANVTIKPDREFNVPDTFQGAEMAIALVRYNATIQELTPAVPQVGELVEVPFDGSGLFGNRAISANFNEDGNLTQISYTSKGGANALANLLDASVAASKEQRDARLAAINREIDLITQEAALRDLIKAGAPEE